ncbi:unnamed protein product [Brachionus calyciflorus]|uniref:Uncharacterized protein n=1 Tax=Brachionus calyciflorus TaxID=104777 RepID=A0A814IUH0_9BILA|nr:unnamed protein product [Brachionus calyciflorus]
MLSIFLFLALCVLGKTIVVKDSFRFCDDTNMPNVFLDIENSCGNTKTKHFMDYEKNVEQKFILLTKQKHLIHGLAHECRKEIIEYDSEEQISLFTTKKKIQTVKLLKTECEYMVKYKKCDDNAMECEGDFCFYESKKLNENSWDFESKKKSVRCTVSTRVLNVDSANEPMFQNSINECLFLHGFCELNDSVFVWSPDKIRHCPYDVVDEISLFQAEDNVYHSREKKIAFKLTGLIFACETSVLTTQEGFFLIPSNNSIVQFPKSKDKNSILNNLKMTDFEFNNYLEMKEYDPNLKKLCLSTLNLMKSSGRANKDFLIVTDFRGNELILINEFGTLLIPQCIAVREIRIYNTSNCYQDIPISFILQDKRFDGFLTHNKIY